MARRCPVLILTVVFLGAMALPAVAQRGLGDQTGVARSGVRPPIMDITGTVTAYKTGTCHNTTGHGVVGAHVILRTPGGQSVNLHLGPAEVLARYADKFVPGATVTARGFRTDAMPETAYVAQSLVVGEETIALRGPDLRPIWALGPGAGGGGGGPMGGHGPMMGGGGPGGGVGPMGGHGPMMGGGGPGGGGGPMGGRGPGSGGGAGGGMGPCYW